MRLVFLGLPGSGKGTQARILSESLGVPQLSTGDMLRQAMADETDLGLQAREYVENGRLVPDDLVLGLMEDRLSRKDCREGFILDGFPRTAEQARGLDGMLSRLGFSLDRVLLIDLAPEVLAKRLGQRRSCPSCGAVYHLEARPPRREGVCDECGDRLITRPDDQRETIERRIEIYRRETEPLVRYYEEKSLLSPVRGDGDIDAIQASLRKVLGIGEGS